MMKIKEMKPHIIGISLIGVILLVMAIVGPIIEERKVKADAEKMEKHHRFAIATTFKYKSVRGKSYVPFYFYYNNKRYNGEFDLPDGQRDKYSVNYNRLFVKFCTIDFNLYDVIYGHYIPDTVMAPRWGWKEMPHFNR